MIDVLLVEGHAAFRQAFAWFLNVQGDLRVVAQVGTAQAALDHLERTGASVVVTELALPDRHGPALVRDLRQADPGAAVLVLTSSTVQQDYAQALQAGAGTVCHKAAPIEDVLDAIRGLADGRMGSGANGPGSAGMLGRDRLPLHLGWALSAAPH
jgi:DNA-binding NarL/FixJ family response regulator